MRQCTETVHLLRPPPNKEKAMERYTLSPRVGPFLWVSSLSAYQYIFTQVLA